MKAVRYKLRYDLLKGKGDSAYYASRGSWCTPQEGGTVTVELKAVDNFNIENIEVSPVQYEEQEVEILEFLFNLPGQEHVLVLTQGGLIEQFRVRNLRAIRPEVSVDAEPPVR